MNKLVSVVVVLLAALCAAPSAVRADGKDIAAGVLAAILLSESYKLSDSEISQLGDEAVREIESKHPAREEGRVSRVGERIAREAKLGTRFRVLEDTEKNAFAVPTQPGTIYVTSGYLATSLSDDQLAFILGHEVGHLAKKHIQSNLKAAGQRRGFFAGALAVSGAGKRAENIAGIVDFIAGNKFSQKQELEADLVGQELSAKAGYNPGAAIDAFARLKTGKEPPRWLNSLFNTHPLISDRQKRLAMATKTASAAATADTPGVNPRGKELQSIRKAPGAIPAVRIAVIRSDIHGDAPSPYELSDRIRLAVEHGLQSAGIPTVGRGSSLDATRREKQLEDADPRTQAEKKGVWMATANLELDTFVEKKYTRLGVTYSWRDFGLQVGDLVSVAVKMNGKFIDIATTQVKPTTVTTAARKRIDQAVVYIPAYRSGRGIYLDIRGQVEAMVRSACEDAAAKTVAEILRLADEIPAQEMAGDKTLPALGASSTTSEPKYTAHIRKNGNLVAIYREGENKPVWVSPNETFEWQADDQIITMPATLVNLILQRNAEQQGAAPPN